MSGDPVTRLNAALEGRYRIERELDEGGMATVYLADDLRHERKVALKVLKPELAAIVGADRFLAEIKTTANLQHSHILPLFDSGEADGFLFYVMPYVEGESLRERLDREHQLPVDDAVRIASDVAEALDYAHRQRVIHRDIKPANILFHAGRPLIADFGIALAVSAGGGGRLTETGLSLGTPHYMSPEQATGDLNVGPATDIYALGAVLYEMLLGEPPYTGRTPQAILGKIIAGEPKSITAQRKSVPPNVDAAIRKALEKLPADRFTRTKDFGQALADPGFRHGESREEALPAVRNVSQRRRAVAAVLSMAAVGSLATVIWSGIHPDPTPVLRMVMGFPFGEEPRISQSRIVAISRDGSQLVYAGAADPFPLWLKPRQAQQGQPLPGTEGGYAPTFSPDGTEIAFYQGGELKRIPVAGGGSITIAEEVQPGFYGGVAWLDDRTLVYVAPGWKLVRTSAAGGSADTLVTGREDVVAGYGGFGLPVSLPDSKGILFSGTAGVGLSNALFAFDFESRAVRKLVDDSNHGWYVSTEHLVYVRTDGAAFAVPFDLESLELTADPVPVLDGLWYSVGPQVVMSDVGDLLYLEGGPRGTRTESLVWVEPGGREELVDPDWEADFEGPALSPDGRTLAVVVGEGARTDVWTKALPNGAPVRLTFDGQANRKPFWGPDDGTVSFLSQRGSNTADVWTKPADGSAEARLVLDLDEPIQEAVWSPDGEWLVLWLWIPGQRIDVVAIRPGLDSVPVPIAATGAEESGPALSPDGRWVAYVSDVTGIPEVYVRPFPEPGSGPQRQVSTGGGMNPWWSADGRQLGYRAPNRFDLQVAELTLVPTLSVTATTVFFRGGTGTYQAGGTYRHFAFAPDFSRVMAIRGTATPSAEARWVYVQNWLADLEEKVRN